MKVFVAGKNGMVGSSIIRKSSKNKKIDVVSASSSDLDLTNQDATNNFFKKNNLNIFIRDDYFPIKKNNLKNIKVVFNPNINRQISYYTGMTFNIQVSLNNKKEVFLSGGRFDSLFKDLGDKKDLNAVVAAINRSIL